jgi:hypothetical protein
MILVWQASYLPWSLWAAAMCLKASLYSCQQKAKFLSSAPKEHPTGFLFPIWEADISTLNSYTQQTCLVAPKSNEPLLYLCTKYQLSLFTLPPELATQNPNTTDRKPSLQNIRGWLFPQREWWGMICGTRVGTNGWGLLHSRLKSMAHRKPLLVPN